MLVVQFRFSVLSSKLRLREDIQIYLCVHSMCECLCLWVSSSLGNVEMFLRWIFLVFLQHIVSRPPPPTYSVFTVCAWTWGLTRHVRNSCQSRSSAVSQTETENVTGSKNGPQSVEREPHVLPFCDPLTDLTQHTGISHRNFKSFHLCLNTCTLSVTSEDATWWLTRTLVNSAGLHVKHQRASRVDSFIPGKLLRSDDSLKNSGTLQA